MDFFFLVLVVLVSVAFFTLLERSVLGYVQIRKGPCKVGYFGLLQPFGDGEKLFFKEQVFPMNSNYLVYLICPFVSLLHSLFVWVLFPYYVNCVEHYYGLLFFLCCSSFGVYGMIVCGWSSNSVYSVLGCIRSVSQAISYEVSLSLVLLGYFLLVDGYSLLNFYFLGGSIWLMFVFIPLFYIWMSCSMAECNRVPFDFSEGESELVSGFNVEYGGCGFSLLFISEYSGIVFVCVFSVVLFMGSDYSSFFFYFSVVFLCFVFVWVRGTFPRYRYDSLMYLAWKCYLPLTLNSLIYFIFISCLCFYHFFC